MSDPLIPIFRLLKFSKDGINSKAVPYPWNRRLFHDRYQVWIFLLSLRSIMWNPECQDSLLYFQSLLILESRLLLENKLKDKENLLHGELLAALLKVHILEILNIHASIYSKISPDSRPASIMAKFISMLENGSYKHNRELAFYASELCIYPHYLSEISKLTSGQPASYWIERFTLQSLIWHIINRKYTLTELANKFNFSSLSYISRFIKKHSGKSYSQLLHMMNGKE